MTTVTTGGFKSLVEFCSSLECKKKSTLFSYLECIYQHKVILVWSVQPRGIVAPLYRKMKTPMDQSHWPVLTGDSSRDQTWSPIWRSLNHLKGHLTIPKGSRKHIFWDCRRCDAVFVWASSSRVLRNDKPRVDASTLIVKGSKYTHTR